MISFSWMDNVIQWKEGSLRQSRDEGWYSLTYMHVVAILICYNQQSPESMSILDLHGLG